MIDIGCGPIGILPQLSERVGPTGRVVGLEREPRFVATARVEVARRGLNNVTVNEGDALTKNFAPESFDLVHERLVLLNVPQRETLLAEMMALLRPSGTIVLQEVDNISWTLYPPHPSWDVLLNAFHAAFQANGGDPFVGRRLPALLGQVGAQDIQTVTAADLLAPNEYRRLHLIRLLDSMQDKILSRGLLDEQTLKRHREALAAHLVNPATTIVDKLLVQAWGRKPLTASIGGKANLTTVIRRAQKLLNRTPRDVA